jgi:GAF domain-containing protein
VTDSASGWVWTHQQKLVKPDLSAEKRFSAALDPFRSRGSRSLAALPMTTADKQSGALVFGNEKAQQYSSETLRQLEAVGFGAAPSGYSATMLTAP